MYRAATALLLLLIAAPILAASNTPFTPSRDNMVLEHVARSSAVTEAFRRLQQAAHAEPNSLPPALAFSRAAIALGNEEGDPRYFGYAQSALAPWWDALKSPSEVLLLKATILQWQHQFDRASEGLAAVIAADGAGVSQAHLTRATLELVQGDPAAARHDCVALIDHVETLIAATCIASANALTGRAATIETSLRNAISQSRDASPEALLWAWTEVAEIADRLGESEAAGGAYANALAIMQKRGHRDPYLLAAYADYLLDRGKEAEVVQLLGDLSRLDNLLLRLALAENALGQRGDAAMRAKSLEHGNDLQRRFDETRQRGDFVHQREEAIYLLKLRHAPEQALAAAEENWRRQRELIDARVLLESASAAHDTRAEGEVAEWLHRLGIEDVRLGAARPQ
jgi:tetratricopeptide (TPR) repeat protein